ncbi:MAG: peptide-methionine (S)-S-oxide reductase MsrA [Sterolibacteriaceae bacterium]|uniref:peptide-methionine (S)-S-oxide reductase MsrA n=1 Tax=Sulfuritalea sp. TaxID=2480090 RepID=UPI001A367762|nr:peptide-methionine (S)-S-oxide reductase MsrA [Sulfuritalea sp.]MBL8478960.1 peptide-methionine (S)-S-oxide reductase MsrA [Sterolibacteriaceae bacterium]MBN8473499.1 peptide-methionine (S)-S-oxide reductase MsrA [Sulfuritalea sp.]
MNTPKTQSVATAVATSVATSVATLGGGCFWCLEAALLQLRGVESVVSGYAGGAMPDPDYRSVCGGETGHAEVVEVHFDPAVIDYRTLLMAFFAIHDPTTLDRQGNDVGTQYRSVIFTHDAEQERIARDLISELAGQNIWPNTIVTAVSPAPTFWRAEDYHQNYYANNPLQGYCQAVVAPKAAKLRKVFSGRLKDA